MNGSYASYTLPTNSDGHIHTKYCHHAIGEMEEYVLCGIEKGLEEIVFLEHMEAGIHYFEKTWLTEDDFDIYFSEGKRLQKKFQDISNLQQEMPFIIATKAGVLMWDRMESRAPAETQCARCREAALASLPGISKSTMTRYHLHMAAGII